MLGKLIKHEFKNSYKLMLTIYGAFALLTLFGCLSVHGMVTDAVTNSWMSVASVLIVVFYALSYFALFLTTFIYNAYNYHKTMYSTQGYLTHTLPAGRTTIFNAKLLTSLIWMICTILLMVASLMLVMRSAMNNIDINDKIAFNDAVISFYETTNMSLGEFLAYMGLFMIMGALEILLWIFTSMAIGQLGNKNRTGLTVLSAILLYVANQILSSIFAISLGVKDHDLIVSSSDINILLQRVFNTIAIYELIVLVILYVATVLINRKKLNLQ